MNQRTAIRRTRTIFSLLALVALAATTAVLAQPPADEIETSRAWERFQERFDTDGDGRITREEFEAGADPFARFDRNDDGVLTDDDFPRRERGHFRARHRGLGIAILADADRDRTVTADEWQAFLAALDDDDDGVFDREDLMRIASERREEGAGDGEPRRPRGPRGHRGPGGPGGPGGMLDHDGDGALEIADLAALFAELDTDGDGSLGEDELPRMRHRRGPRGGF